MNSIPCAHACIRWPYRHVRHSVLWRRSSRALRQALLGFVLALNGCHSNNSPTADVEGRITFSSQPVTEGNVVLENAAKGWLSVAPLDAQGMCHFEEVKLGQYALSVQPPELRSPDETSGSLDRAVVTPKKNPDPKNIPRRFRDSQSTPLKITVADDSNRFEFDLATDH